MNQRRLLATLTLPAAFALAACSSTTNGTPTTGGTTHVDDSGVIGAGGACGDSTSQSDAKGLSDVMQCASATVKSAHIDLHFDAAGQEITGSGDEELSEGVLTGLNLTESLPENAGNLTLVIADGKTYAMLPSSINPSDKPWVVIRSDSSDPTIQQLSASLAQTSSSASIGSTTAFVTAARSVTNKGSENIDGVDTTHYSVDVDPTKLPADNAGMDAAAQAGITSIPVELYIDSQGRPVKVTEDFSVQGQSVSVEVTVSKYDQPVNISAPPADQVATP